MQKRKVAVIGAGHVGSHVALSLAQAGTANEIVLLDCVKEKAAAQAMDIDDCLSGALCGYSVSIAAGTYQDIEDADILILAFGRSRRAGENRLDLFDDSIRMANDIIKHLKSIQFKGIMISISNPADIICEYIRRKMGWDRKRCFCTGTGLETYRLLRVLSRRTGINRRDINGFCMGEHGNSGFIVWSHVYLRNTPILHIHKDAFSADVLDKHAIQEEVRWAGDMEVENKGCTEFGIANVVNQLVADIFGDQKRMHPCSVALKGEYGQIDVAVGVPCIVGKNGIEKVLEIPLTAEEQEAFIHTCEIIKGFLKRADEVQ